MNRRLALTLCLVATGLTACLLAASTGWPWSFEGDPPGTDGRSVRIDCFGGYLKLTYYHPQRISPRAGEADEPRFSAPGLFFRTYPNRERGIWGPAIAAPRGAAVLQLALWWPLLLFGAYPLYRFIRAVARADSRGASARRVCIASSCLLAASACLVLGHARLQPGARILAGGEDGRVMIARDFDGWCLLLRFGDSWRRSGELFLGRGFAEFHWITPTVRQASKSGWEILAHAGFGIYADHLPPTPFILSCGTGSSSATQARPFWSRFEFYQATMKPGSTRWQVRTPAWFVSLVLFVPPVAVFTKSIVRTRRRRRRGLCITCGYDLTGNVTGVCSECGTVFDSTKPEEER